MKLHNKHVAQFKGFTLIELLITVAIIGILAAIALPNYAEYIRRSHRTDARDALIQAAQWMERVATANGSYPVDLAPPDTSPIPASLLTVASGRYTVSLTSSTASAYTFQAARAGAQTGDSCGDFVLTHTNARTTANRTAAQIAEISDQECWSR